MAATQATIRASEVSTVLGLNPRKSRLALYLEMRGELPAPDLDANEAIIEGREFEDAIARIARRKFKLEDGEGPLQLSSGIFVGHPDRYVVNPHDDSEPWKRAVLEVKHTFLDHFSDEQWGPNGSDVVPTAYWMQAAVYAWLNRQSGQDMPADFAFLAARLAGGVRLYKIPALHGAMLDKVHGECAEFLEAIHFGRPPQPQDEADMRIRWLADRKKRIGVTLETVHQALAYQQLGQQIIKLQEERSRLATLLIGTAQDASYLAAAHPKTGAVIDVVSVASDRVFDEAAFLRDCPEVAAKCMKLDKTALAKAQPKLYEQYKREPIDREEQKRVLRCLKDLNAFIQVQP